MNSSFISCTFARVLLFTQGMCMQLAKNDVIEIKFCG